MSNASAKLAGDILSYYSTPVGTAPFFNAAAEGDALGQAVGLAQTGLGLAQMFGKTISNPVTIAVPLTALGADSFKMGTSYNQNGTISTSDLYSAAGNLSALAGSIALIEN